MSFWSMTICSDTLHWSDITQTCDLVTVMDLITEFHLFIKFREVSIEHLQLVQHANRGRLLWRTPGTVLFGTCICSKIETCFSKSCHVPGLWISISNISWHISAYWKSHRPQNKRFIRGAIPGVSDQLWDKDAIGWREWDVASQERKVCNMEIEMVTLVVKGSAKLTSTDWQE